MQMWSYHVATSVKEVGNELVLGRIYGGRLVDGPEKPGDYVRTDDGKFYQITEVIVKVKPVTEEIQVMHR